MSAVTSLMTYTLETTRRIPLASISTSDRFCEPAQKQIDEMASSLATVGQLTAIMVHPVTRNTYRIVVGGTRLRAAFKLGWTHIRADIIAGSKIDYKIIELTENFARRNLTADQRKATKKELKRLLAEKLATIQTAKGGRGHKGGMREAARQMGVALATAQRAAQHKPTQNTEAGSVSEPKPNGGGNHEQAAAVTPSSSPTKPSLALEQMRAPTSVKITVSERSRIERYNKERCGGGFLSDCCRKLMRAALDAEGY